MHQAWCSGCMHNPAVTHSSGQPISLLQLEPFGAIKAHQLSGPQLSKKLVSSCRYRATGIIKWVWALCLAYYCLLICVAVMVGN